MSGARPRPARVADIDWTAWRPADLATLVFIVSGGQVLLNRKKRGLGAGKINAPGGRIDDGESPEACAAREVHEELRTRPVGLSAAGTLRFQFADGYGIHVYVFRASGCEGTPAETDEAVPIWTPVDAIPFDEMWADDRLWVPHLLAGRPFDGRFVFDGDTMLDHDLQVGPAAAPPGPGAATPGPASPSPPGAPARRTPRP
jgi:8-oxo-dGTP diphosphatase